MKQESMADFEKARALLREFKGKTYLFGSRVLSRSIRAVPSLGQRIALVRGTFAGSDDWVKVIRTRLCEAGVGLAAEIPGARPNTPREDVTRIAAELEKVDADVVISYGGGSTIDATKAAEVLRTLGGPIDNYFGVGLVSAALAKAGRSLHTHIALQTVASSAAHLTKYANITDLANGLKKLIVDDSIVPALAAFDYEVTCGTPLGLTADGAFDGLSHCLEVLYGAVRKPYYERAARIADVCLPLILTYLPSVLANPSDPEARGALCLATDLGGYAIMVGGTGGGHLTSFSLVDILPHGRACAIMNPYYTVFFAPAIEEPLRLVGGIYHRAGWMEADVETLQGRELGVAVAVAMLNFARRVGFPTRLKDVDGFTEGHIRRALTAARDPQLSSKLQNMPVPMTPEMVDEYMGPILAAARDGNLSLIKNVA